MTRGSKADEILTLFFMLLAIAAVVCYFAVSDKAVFLVLWRGGDRIAAGAICLKIYTLIIKDYGTQRYN